VYDVASQNIANVDPLGNTTTVSYDLRGRQIATQSPMNFVSTTAYDSDGRVVGSVDPLGNINTTLYDNAGRDIGKVNPLGYITTAVYDNAIGRSPTLAAGLSVRPASTTTRIGQLLHRIRWDIFPVRHTTRRPDRSHLSIQRKRHNINLGTDDSRKIAKVDALSTLWTTVYDPDRRVIASIDP